MDMILMKNFLMDLFRFMKKFPKVQNGNWQEIADMTNVIYYKYNQHSLVKKFLLAYMDYLEEKENIRK